MKVVALISTLACATALQHSPGGWHLGGANHGETDTGAGGFT